MSEIVGIKSGYTPSPDIYVSRPIRQPTAVEFKCICCDGIVVIRNKKTAKTIDRDTFSCNGCHSLFSNRNRFIGDIHFNSFEQTVAKLSALTDNSWVMARYDRQFACSVTGRSLNMTSGDIFKVVRIGTNYAGDTTYSGSIKKFTIDISFGSQVVTLFVHEFVEVSWMDIMDSAKANELKYTYLEQSDQWGIYEPANDEIRQELQSLLQ